MKPNRSIRSGSTDRTSQYIESGFIITVNDLDEKALGNSRENISLPYIYPNPFVEKAIISLPESFELPYSLSITDISGKAVRITEKIYSRNYELLRGELPEGIYLIEIRGNRNYRGRIIIQ